MGNQTQRRAAAAEIDAALDKSVRGRIGKWIWLVLLGVDLAYEVVAFLDGTDGFPTLSQLVKRAERAGGLAAGIALSAALFGAAVVLTLHWVVQAF